MSVLFATPVSAKKIGLILSGGGARGLAQIGVLKALDENNIRPQLIVGTSVGAVVGALYAAGFSADSIHAIVRSVDWNDIFANAANRPSLLVSQKAEPIDFLLEFRFSEHLRPMLPQSISYGQQFYDILVPRLAPAQYRCRGNFDSLRIPLRIVTTDIITGKRVVFSRGNLATIIRASSGVPLAFSPVSMDSMLLMDGGLTANVPVEPAIEEKCDYLIAVDVTSPMWQKGDIDNPIKLMDQVVAIGITRQKEVERSLASRVISPKLTGYFNTDFTRIDSLVRLGYRATMEKMDSIKADLAAPDSITIQESYLSDRCYAGVSWASTEKPLAAMLDSALIRYQRKNPWAPLSYRVIDSIINIVRLRKDIPYCRIDKIDRNDSTCAITINPGRIAAVSVAGNEHTAGAMIQMASGLKKGMLLNSKSMANAIDALYSTGLFSTVNIELDSVNIVRITVNENKHLRARFGLRYDEFHLLEGYAEPAYENLFGWGILGLLHIQYGLRREKYALEFQANNVVTPWWANNLGVQAYSSRETIVNRTLVPLDTLNRNFALRYDEMSLRKDGLMAMMGTQVGRVAMLDAGIKIERFQTTTALQSIFRDPLGRFHEGMRYAMVNLRIDNLDRFPFPKTGNQHRITLGGAWDKIGGTASFIKLDGSLRYYWSIPWRHTISACAQIGGASDFLPDVEKFFLGGVLNEERYREMGVYNYIPFTGMKPRALPGDLMALAHVDYRLTLLKDFYLAAMIDWGNAWYYDDFEFTSSFLSKTIKEIPLGVGLGLAYNSIFGPIRFSWGLLLREPNDELYPEIIQESLFYLSAGHDF